MFRIIKAIKQLTNRGKRYVYQTRINTHCCISNLIFGLNDNSYLCPQKWS